MLSQAEQYLLEQVRSGDADGWMQLVDRFSGRLTAFAARQLGNAADAEDLVQETFISFIKSLDSFEGRSGLESYLFAILRRKIIDRYRGRKVNLCSLNQPLRGDANRPAALADHLPAPDPTASWYVRKDEQVQQLAGVLADALYELVGRYRDDQDFVNLQVIELLFYAQARNRQIAELLDISDKKIGLLKHRFINRLAKLIADQLNPDSSDDQQIELQLQDNLLTQTWESLRPSCPKRSTLGRFVLGTLDPAWHRYIDFHLNQLGCRFCQANVEDLTPDQPDHANALRDKIMQSTIGFLSRPE